MAIPNFNHLPSSNTNTQPIFTATLNMDLYGPYLIDIPNGFHRIPMCLANTRAALTGLVYLTNVLHASYKNMKLIAYSIRKRYAQTQPN